MIPVFYDTHAHLDYPDYKDDFGPMLERASAAGIKCIICIGTDIASSEAAIELAEKHSQIFAVVGWHPSSCLEAPDDVREPLRRMAKHSKVVAIGETGLDHYRLPGKTENPMTDDATYKQKQRRLFEQHLEVAAETGLNCVIHERDAFEDTFNCMSAWKGKVRGVFHCFVGAPAIRNRLEEIDALVSFTGICTFKNAQIVRDTIASAPLGSFMLETDCPYLAPVPFRGKRCEPAYVKEIAALVANVKNCTLDQISESTCSAAHQFFPKLLGP